MNKKNKTLVIVESPSKAKTIEKYLGEDYIVLASRGHMIDLAKGGKHKLGIDIQNNFKPHYIILDDKVQLLQEIMDTAKKVKAVILASDPDREGMAIAYHIYERIKDHNANIKRAIFTEITKKEIIKALDNLQDINSSDNLNMFHSQEARRMLDRIVGFMASPFLMSFFGPNLSAGRVQSVIVRLITDREQEINDFKPEEYFTIQANLEKDKNAFIAKYDHKITNKKIAENTKIELEDQSAKYIISNVEAAEEKKKPFAPLITAKLQQIMSKKYGINSSRTMKAAQSLYEAGLITYMRTDSTRIGDDALKEVRSWLKENNYDIPKSANYYKNKNNSQDAHEAIRPTHTSETPETIGIVVPDEKIVYEVIWKYFVASQMKPAIYDTLKVNIILSTNSKHTLTTSGKALKYKGFLEVLGIIDNNIIDIPALSIGDEVKLFGNKPIIMERKQTQPPSRYSEASLIEILEKKEIGRPATYAQLISTVSARNYVEQEGTIFRPTELGKVITNELIKWFSFLEYNYTQAMETKLDDIAEGKLDHIEMLKEFYSTFNEQLNKAYMKHGAVFCQCGGILREITSKKGDKFLGCSQYPNCKITKSISKKVA